MTDKPDAVLGRGGAAAGRARAASLRAAARVNFFSVKIDASVLLFFFVVFFLGCCPGEVRARMKALAVG